MVERCNAMKNKKTTFVLYIPLLIMSAVLWFLIQINARKQNAGKKTAE